MTIPDISNVPKNGKIYNGTTRKFGITLNGVDYIVKFPKDADMSVYCEYLASNFIRELGISCHEVTLGVYNGVLVNLIKDFTCESNMTLHSFKDTKQSSEDTELTDKEYTYEDVLYLIDKHLKMTDEAKVEAKQHFWDMFICDALIGNRDRHWGNWGYLKSVSKEGNYVFAPLYDNGAGLYPGISKVIDAYADSATRKQFLHDRVFVFPASLFKIRKPDRAYRSNYAEMFQDVSVSRIFEERVNRFRHNTSYEKVFNTMQHLASEIPLEPAYRRFYTEVVTLRCMCIVFRMDFDEAYDTVERMLVGHE